MTGGADFKEEMIRLLVHAGHLSVGHDAPAALAGASGCGPGVVVIAGTGSAAYGENGAGACARAGGWGYLFGDEGSGFAIALGAIRRCTQVEDGWYEATQVLELLLKYFKVSDLRSLVQSFYSGRLKRDELAAFAQELHDAALHGAAEAQRIIQEGTESLARLVTAVSRNLKWDEGEMRVFPTGGMFRGSFFLESFKAALKHVLPSALISKARFEPVVGALLLAYRAAEIGPDKAMLSTLDEHCRGHAKNSETK
jgi:N-acetylglucosamine kinase-like BadF-type ATPase